MVFWCRPPQVRFKLEGRAFTLQPPDASGWPVGEVSPRPLLEALRPDHLLLAFLAVLLERRVLLVGRQPRLLTLAAEALRLLLWPLRYCHVYVPVVPAGLADLLDAPTPFLMGLISPGGGGDSISGNGSNGSSRHAMGAGGAAQGWASGGAAAAASGDGGGGSVAAALAARGGEGLVVIDLDR